MFCGYAALFVHFANEIDECVFQIQYKNHLPVQRFYNFIFKHKGVFVDEMVVHFID